MTLPIGPGTRVHLNFEISLSDGQMVDSNFDKPPVQFVVGDEKLLFGFEKVLFGLVAGDERVFTVPPEDGFGEHNEDNIQFFPPDTFEVGADLEIGMVVNFSDPAGNSLPGVVVGFDERRVTVDFNHPTGGTRVTVSGAYSRRRAGRRQLMSIRGSGYENQFGKSSWLLCGRRSSHRYCQSRLGYLRAADLRAPRSGSQ